MLLFNGTAKFIYAMKKSQILICCTLIMVLENEGHPHITNQSTGFMTLCPVGWLIKKTMVTMQCKIQIYWISIQAFKINIG